jgi:predicted amidohydrolase
VLRVAVLELPARWGPAAEALARVDALLAVGPTDLALVPELALTGYVSPRGIFDPSRFAEPITGPTVVAAGELAVRHRCHLVVPLVLQEGTRLSNAAVLLGPDGDVRAIYRKRHPWIPERWATPGRAPYPIVEVGGLRVTMAICYDAQFLHDDGAAVLDEVDLLLFTSAWVEPAPVVAGPHSGTEEEDSRLPLLRGLARRFGITIANANWAEGVVVVPGQGGSCVVDASGDVVARVRDGRADAGVSPRRSRGR